MKTIVKGGMWIGVLCGVWVLITGITGWYKDPVWMNAFWLVIAIQIGVLLWMLRGTAADGAGYGRQVVNGVLMSLVAGVILFLVSVLFTEILYPRYFEEMRAVRAAILRSRGMSEADITQALQVMAGSQTTFMQALSGFLGTLLTGLVASLVIAIFLKKKPNPAP